MHHPVQVVVQLVLHHASGTSGTTIVHHASGTCGTPGALSSTSGTTSHVLCLSTSSVDYEFLYNCLGRYLNFTNHLFAHTVHVQEDLFPFDAASFVPNFTMNISSLQNRDKVFKFVHNTQ